MIEMFDGRLGVLSGTTCGINEKGQLMVNHAIGLLFVALKARCKEIRFCLPLLDKPAASHNFVFDIDREDVDFLPPLITTIQAQKHYLASRRVVKNFCKTVDALFIRVPIQLPSIILNLKIPKMLHVVANPLEILRASTDYKGLLGYASMQYASYSSHAMRRALKEPHTYCCTNGSEMWHELQATKGQTVLSSCLPRAMMRDSDQKGIHKRPKILFVGYLRPEKGVLDLLDAFDLYREKYDGILNLVGGCDRSDTQAGALIQKRIAASPYAKDIHQLGMMNFGEALFDLYCSHDVLVQPSLSEGTPRTLVEARSFGCPVIGTRVGGIPFSIENGVDGLLANPADPKDLARVLEKILSDETLRQDLVLRGLELREQYSIEYFADTLIGECTKAKEEKYAKLPL